MIIQTDSPTKEYDYYIVGSGPAGIVLALELEKSNKKILIIESGGHNEINLETSPVIGLGHYSGTYWNHHWIRMYGGTSAIWGGQMAPLDERDFNSPNPLLPSWPITLNELHPFYKQAAKVLGKKEFIIDFREPYLDKLVYKPFSGYNAVRFGETFSYMEKSSSIDVMLNSTVVGFEAKSNRKVVQAIRYHNHRTSKKHTIKLNEKQNVIVAAGGIGNAQLLLQSKPGSGAAVGNESGMVGRFLMEHPHVYDAASIFVNDKKKIPDATWNFGAHVDALIIDDRYYRALNMFAFTLDSRPSHGDERTHLMEKSILKGHSLLTSHARSEMLPDPENRVFLSGETEVSGILGVMAQCVLNANDYRNVENGIRFVGKVLMENNAGRIMLNNENLYKNITGGGHIMGTTRMGNHPKTSVVDKNNRVHGYANFYVSGSSVFTTSGASNPTLTIVALTLRLADHLRRKNNA